VEKSPPRVNNFEEKAKQLGLVKRSWESAFDIATKDLERDTEGNVRVGSYSALPYNLLYNNCEMFASYCKYDYPGGWTEQAMNVWKAVIGGLSSFTTQMAGNIPNMLNTDAPLALKVPLVVLSPVYVGLDVAVDTASNVMSPVISTLQNVGRPGGTVSEERESTSKSYSSPASSGAFVQTSRESHQAHWSVFSAGVAGPSAGAGAHAGFDGVSAEVKAEMIRTEVGAGPVKVGVGLQTDTGVSIRKGKVGASLLGFGAEVGGDGLKVKTPVADASCCVV